MTTGTPPTEHVLWPNRAASALLRPAVHAWAMERPYVVAAGLARGATVLDLGCGDGEITRMLAGEVGPRGAVVGLDVDEDLIASHRAADAGRAGVPLTWTCASAYDTGLADGSVDLVVARHLFQHLTDPARALVEIRRVLRPGGGVCLLDAHDGLLWIHPEPAGHAALVGRAAEQQRLRGGDREVGRKHPGRLIEAGFGDVRSDVRIFDTGGLPAELFAALALEPVLAAFDGPARDDARAHLSACVAALSEGGAHGSAGFHATSARRT